MPTLRLATITLNGTLDRVILAPGFSPGKIQSSADVWVLPSGKGVNVARTARALGCEVLASGLVAGKCGQWIRSLMKDEEIPERFLHLPEGESRISTIIVDPESKETTVVNDLGPAAPSSAWPDLCLRLSRATAGYPWVALCGSSLPGLPSSVYADLCRDMQARGQRVCLDTRDQWLASTLPLRPYLVKCNQYEASRVWGRPVHTAEQALDVARDWIGAGIGRVVITMGDQGAIAVEKERAWRVEAPSVDALYPIGSGDAMMAGLIFALDRKDPLPVALQFGVALGTANTLVPGSGRCDLDVIPELLQQTPIHEI